MSYRLILKEFVRWIAIIGLVGTYISIFIPIWLITALYAYFTTDVSLFGEFFPTKKRRERDKLQQETNKEIMGTPNKLFLAAFHALKRW